MTALRQLTPAVWQFCSVSIGFSFLVTRSGAVTHQLNKLVHYMVFFVNLNIVFTFRAQGRAAD
jgi:hypothetical protein